MVLLLFLPFLRPGESNVEAKAVEGFWFFISRMKISQLIIEVVVAQFVEQTEVPQRIYGHAKVPSIKEIALDGLEIGIAVFRFKMI